MFFFPFAYQDSLLSIPALSLRLYSQSQLLSCLCAFVLPLFFSEKTYLFLNNFLLFLYLDFFSQTLVLLFPSSLDSELPAVLLQSFFTFFSYLIRLLCCCYCAKSQNNEMICCLSTPCDDGRNLPLVGLN